MTVFHMFLLIVWLSLVAGRYPFGPFMVDDRISVGAGFILEFRALRVWQSLSDAVEIAERASFKIYVEVGGAKLSPYGVKHEPKNDRVSRAQDAQLPAD